MDNIGEMNKLVQLVEVDSVNEGGVAREERRVLASFYAAAVPAGAREQWGDGAETYRSLVNFTIWPPKNDDLLKLGHFLLFKDMKHEIIDVKPHPAHDGRLIVKTARRGTTV